MRIFNKNIVILLVVSFVLSGCATPRYPVKYSFDKDLYVNSTPLPYKVLIDVFEDDRPIDERQGKARVPGFGLYSKDKLLKPEVALQASQMLAEHFKKVGLFSEAEVRSVSKDLELNAEEMGALSQQGIDLVITGKLKHLYGYQSGNAGLAVLTIFTVFLEALFSPKKVGANIEYADVKIIDIANQKVLWQGDIKYEFQDRDTFYKGPYGYALIGLKEANNRFVEKIKEVFKE